MTEYVWKIFNLNIGRVDALPFEDVVQSAGFAITGSTSEASFTYQGSVDLEPPVEGGPYTPLPELTEDQVLDWVMLAVSPERYDSIKEVIEDRIAAQLAPQITTVLPPWEVPAPVAEPEPSAE
jgi:hypothetical protein